MTIKSYVCKSCSRAFDSNKFGSKYCSHACKIAWEAVYYKRTKVNPTSRECAVCGKEFITSNNKQRYCGRPCYRIGTADKIKAWRASNVSSDTALRFSILARDGFRCRYCGATPQESGVKLGVDHILAVSRGGSNNPLNLITACSKCNVGKGSKLLLTNEGIIPTYVVIESMDLVSGSR